MKKKLWIISIIFMLAVIGTANAQQYDPESDFKTHILDLNEKFVIIDAYNGSKKEVRIPPTIQGLPVRWINANSFVFQFNITSVNIPDSITYIKTYEKLGSTFLGCVSLTAINVSAGNKEYMSDNGILYSKEKNVLYIYPMGKKDSSFVIPDSVTGIDGYAFEGCTNLTSITIPNKVTYIGRGVFYGCKNLASITLPNSVGNIDEFAFNSCSKITSIIIPKSVKGLGQFAFGNCTNLVSVTFQGTIDKEYFGYEYDNVYDEYSEGVSPFLGDLREKFYATDKINGTPGTYTRAGGGKTWTRK